MSHLNPFTSVISLSFAMILSAHPVQQSSGSTAKSEISHRYSLKDGSYCFVHESHGDHPAQQVWFFVPGGTISPERAKQVALRLVGKHILQYPAKLLTAALNEFQPAKSKNPDHWQIEVQDSMFTECSVQVDWLGGSTVIYILVAAVPL